MSTREIKKARRRGVGNETESTASVKHWRIIAGCAVAPAVS